MQDTFSRQFVTGRIIKMECWECGFSTLKIISKDCQDMKNYKACLIFTKCENCNAHDDFFINKDYYGYIDVEAKPLSGEWKL